MKHVRWLVVAVAATLALAVTAGPAIGANGTKALTASDVGITPTEIQLVAPAFIDAYRRAEKEGYDAVVPLGMLDLGVDGRATAGWQRRRST